LGAALGASLSGVSAAASSSPAPERDLKRGAPQLRLVNRAMHPEGLPKEVIKPASGFESEGHRVDGSGCR
jgi:hypothetical protein